ncbi:MAG TPA: VWA domain-containing protein [Blastococcus sp.]|nr:uncharacterized protein [Blastococcus sp.]
MDKRPGGGLAGRPLHFIWIADCSGSMQADGKIQALNNAIREAIPHLRDLAARNPHAQILVRALAFSSGTRWHVPDPTPVERLIWPDLLAYGYTDLGAALTEVASVLRSPPMEPRSLPPALVLVSDGEPTDDFEAGIAALMAEPWGAKAVRLAIGIGRDADTDVLQRFIGRPDIRPVTAAHPEQLVQLIRWASTVASRAASTPAVDPAGQREQWRPPEQPRISAGGRLPVTW